MLLTNRYRPWRWYRILQPDSSLWMETSDPDEAMGEWEQEIQGKKGWKLQRLWRKEQTKWRKWDGIR